MRIFASVLAVFAVALALWIQPKADDELSGVVTTLEEKYKPLQRASDELTGIVVDNPKQFTPEESQVRVCTFDNRFVNLVVPGKSDDLADSGVCVGHVVATRGCSTLPGYISCAGSIVRILKKSPKEFCTISQGCATGSISCDSLTGDGVNTTMCSVKCSNNTDHAMRVCIPRGQSFKPDKASHQDMVCTNDVVCDIPAKSTVTMPLQTMCASPKTILPPPRSGISYSLGTQSLADAKLNDRLITGSTLLEQEHFNDHLPLNREKRSTTLCQLALWIEKGLSSKNPTDRVSVESLKQDVLSQSDLTLDQLTSDQRKVIDHTCQSVFKAANLTLQLAKTPRFDGIINGTARMVASKGGSAW